MYKIFNALLNIIWILDILNIPAMEFLDNQIPINGWAWLLIWLFIPSTATTIRHKSGDEL